MMKHVLFLANDQNFENDWKNIFDMCLAWCYIYVWLLIYYVSVFICSSTDIWCKIINISCIYLHYLQSYDHLNIFIIIYWNIFEYIQRWRVMLKKIFSAERVKSIYFLVIDLLSFCASFLLIMHKTCADLFNNAISLYLGSY